MILPVLAFLMATTPTPISIFDPQKMEPPLLRSSIPAPALRPGEYSKIVNARLSGRLIQVRNGSAKLTTSIPANATLRGAFLGKLNGTKFWILALAVSGATRIYKVDTGTFAFTEITSTAGWFGDTTGTTRFTSATDDVAFTVVRAPASSFYGDRDILVCSNGVEAPRLFDSLQSANFQLSIHQAITPPTTGGTYRQLATLGAFFPVSGVTRPVYTNSTAHFTLADLGSTPRNAIVLTADTSVATSATAMAKFAAPIAFSGRQMCLLVDCINQAQFLQGMKVEYAPDVAGSPGTWQQAYDPTSANLWQRDYRISAQTGTRALIAFPLDAIKSGATRAAQYVRFTWVGSAPPTATIQMTVLVIASSGDIPGGSHFGFSYEDHYGHVESPGYVSPSSSQEDISNLGGPIGYGAIPEFQGIYYDYRVSLPSDAAAGPVQGGLNGIPSSVNIYLQRPGDSDYFYFLALQLFTPGTFASPFVGNGWAASYVDPVIDYNTATHTRTFGMTSLDPSRKLPDTEALPIPIGKVTADINQRLFVGNTFDGTNYARGDVWVSEDANPFRFRRALHYRSPGVPDALSATRFTLPGEEIRAFSRMSGHYVDVNSVLIFTDQGLWTISGVDGYSLSRPSLISPTGTASGNSVTTFRTDTYWLDSDRQIRKIAAGNMEILTRETVEDQLRDAVSVASASGAIWKERFHLSFVPLGGSLATSALVWDERRQRFVTDELGEGNVGRFVIDDNGDTRRLLFVTTAGHIYEHDKAGVTADGSTSGVALALKTWDFTAPAEKQIYVGRVGIICDKQNGVSLTINRKYKPTNQTRSSTLDLTTASNPYAEAWSKEPDVPTVDGMGSHCQLEILGTLAGGTTIYKILTQIDERNAAFLSS